MEWIKLYVLKWQKVGSVCVCAHTRELPGENPSGREQLSAVMCVFLLSRQFIYWRWFVLIRSIITRACLMSLVSWCTEQELLASRTNVKFKRLHLPKEELLLTSMYKQLWESQCTQTPDLRMCVNKNEQVLCALIGRFQPQLPDLQQVTSLLLPEKWEHPRAASVKVWFGCEWEDTFPNAWGTVSERAPQGFWCLFLEQKMSWKENELLPGGQVKGYQNCPGKRMIQILGWKR